MLDWLFRKRKSEFPSYSLLEAVPCRQLPQDLVERESSEEFSRERDRLQAELFDRRPNDQMPNFATFLGKDNGVVTRPLPQSNCLLVFSTPIHAADYARVLLPGEKVGYLCLTPLEAVSFIRQLRERNVSDVTIDLWNSDV